MKIAGLVIGILLMILGVVGGIVCLLLPSMTNNRVSFEESLLGLIPAIVVAFIGLLLTIVSVFFIMKAKKTAQ